MADFGQRQTLLEIIQRRENDEISYQRELLERDGRRTP
jgi:hypothetical protein